MPDPFTLPEGAIRCLDRGFIRLVEAMGGDEAIVQAARVSYGKGTRKVSEDRGLIRYLMRHRHTTPFEMVEMKFHVKMPIFVARQWVRHRTANINEYSLRYSEARDEFYIPEAAAIHYQSEANRQGRDGGDVPTELRQKVRESFEEISRRSFALYQEMNAAGIARELARAVLPVNLYTEWYWKNDLHNTFRFLSLRMDPHAQHEIRVYAEAMASLVRKVAPVAYEAFEDYELGSFRFSSVERSLLARRLPERVVDDLLEDTAYRIVASLYAARPRSTDELFDLYRGSGGSDSRRTFSTKWVAGGIEGGNVRELKEFREKLERMRRVASSD